MASNQHDLVGDFLQEVGKAFTASAIVAKTAAEMTIVKENLESLKNQLLKIDFDDPSQRQLLAALDADISLANDICKFAILVGEKHSTCLQVYKELANLTEITHEQIEAVSKNFNEFLRLCVKFNDKLTDFMASFAETRDQAIAVENLAKKEADRLNRSAAETRSEAKKKSILLLAAKIATFGLIRSYSGFQEAVAETSQRFNEANKLQESQQKLQKTCQELRDAMKSMDKIEERVLKGPIKLSKEMVETVLECIRLYEHWERMTKRLGAQENTILEKENTILEKENTILKKDNTILEKENTILKKDDEIAKLKAQIEQMGKSSSLN